MVNISVEILAINPCEDDLTIVPIFEQIIEMTHSDSAEPRFSLAQALGTFAGGEDIPLIGIMEADERACEFILRLEDTWFVRAEGVTDSPNGQVREASQARHLARIIQGQRMASRAADEACASIDGGQPGRAS